MPSIHRICCTGVLLLGILGAQGCKKTASEPPVAELSPNASEVAPPLDEASAKVVVESIEKLKDPDPRARQLAAETLGKYKTDSAVLPLVQCLKDADEGVRDAATSSLKQIGTLAISGLIKPLGDPEEKVRVGAISVLWWVPINADELRSNESFAALISALKDKTVDVRIHAAMILGNIGPDTKRALPDLMQASKDMGNMGLRSGTTPGSVAEAAIQAALEIDPE
jgi:HEAT repeat protein